MNSKVPTTLYCATAKRQDSLCPGFLLTQEVTDDIKGRTNEWLYASTNADVAIAEALERVIRQQWQVDVFTVDGHELLVKLNVRSPPMTEIMVHRIALVLNTINVRSPRDWESETVGEEEVYWRTQRRIDSIRGRRLISMYDWMMDRSMRIHHPRFR